MGPHPGPAHGGGVGLGGDLLKALSEPLDGVEMGPLDALLPVERSDADPGYQDHDDQINHAPRSPSICFLIGVLLGRARAPR